MLNPVLNNTSLSSKEYERYCRQIIIEEISEEGQKRMQQAKIICIGAGGLNSSALLYLAASGIGTIGIIDFDTIEISNLQRQIIYTTSDTFKKKVDTVYTKLNALNPLIKIKTYNNKLNVQNIEKIFSSYDIIIDGTDDLKIKNLISKFCHRLHKIHIYGAIDKFTGHISVFNYQNGPHYHDLYHNINNIELGNCDQTGILNTLAGAIGIIQATEAIKIITGIGSTLGEHLMVFNLKNLEIQKIKITPQVVQHKRALELYQDNNANYIPYVSMENLNNINCFSYQFIDIRSPIEYKISKIDKSINIPLQQLRQLDRVPYIKNQLIKYKPVIYCNNEIRSYIASKILRSNQIKHYVLQGGFNKIKATRKERDSNPR